MVDIVGKNRYMEDESWLTAGSGDFVGPYLRVFAAMPLLAPATQGYMLSTRFVIQHVFYWVNWVNTITLWQMIYKTYNFTKLSMI